MRLTELDFDPGFAVSLPETYALITSGSLTVHPSVSRVVLHGSRGPAGGYRPDSDIDLSLIVDSTRTSDAELQQVLQTTLSQWHSQIELDLAVIFDIGNCRLACFEQTTWDTQVCQMGGVDCFGLYKLQKGFTGLVTNAGIQVKLMYPCLKIWQRRWVKFLT